MPQSDDGVHGLAAQRSRASLCAGSSERVGREGCTTVREGHTRRGTRLGGGGRLGRPCQLGLRGAPAAGAAGAGGERESRPRRAAAHAAGDASPGTRAGKRPDGLALSRGRREAGEGGGARVGRKGRAGGRARRGEWMPAVPRRWAAAPAPAQELGIVQTVCLCLCELQIRGHGNVRCMPYNQTHAPVCLCLCWLQIRGLSVWVTGLRAPVTRAYKSMPQSDGGMHGWAGKRSRASLCVGSSERVGREGCTTVREGHTRRGTRLGGGGRLGRPCQLGLRGAPAAGAAGAGGERESRPRRASAHAAGGASPGTRAGKRPDGPAPPATKASSRAAGRARAGQQAWSGGHQ